MSEFWQRKMKTYFKVHDFDKDGYVSEKDYVEIGRKFAESNKATTQRKEEFMKNMSALWRNIMRNEDLKKNNRMTLPILMESLGQRLYDPEFVSVATRLMQRMFELLDVNEDGFLQPEEHKRWFDNMGFPEELFKARVAFDAMDTNHDNKLSLDEFKRGYFDFMFSQDESSPNKFFWGPLVE